MALISWEALSLLWDRARTVSPANLFIVACAITGFYVIIRVIIKWILMAMVGAAGTFVVGKVILPLALQHIGG